MKLMMTDTAALDFSRYIIEQAGQTISYDETDEADKSSNFVMVDQERKTIGIKVIMQIHSMIRSTLVYFREEKEEKMKLIIGEKLQEPQAKAKLL